MIVQRPTSPHSLTVKLSITEPFDCVPAYFYFETSITIDRFSRFLALVSVDIVIEVLEPIPFRFP